MSSFIELAKKMTISDSKNAFATNKYGVECYNNKGENIYLFNFDKKSKEISKLRSIVKDLDKIMQ